MRDRIAFWIETIAAGLSGFLFLFTIAWPQWIEGVFGIDPDQHNGSLEWAIVAALFVAAATFGYLARRTWRRIALAG
jgi:hypothetical protein